jgi:hypothetical protein
MITPRRRAHGLTLTEVLLVIGVLMIAFAVESRLFRSAIVATQSAPESVQQHARLDQAIGVMRADVWNAKRIDVANPQTIALQLGDGATVTWRLDATGAIRAAAENTTYAFQPPLAAKASPGGISLAAVQRPDDAIQLTSQLLMMGGDR